MENAEALRHALEKLADRRRGLASSLDTDRTKLAEVESKIDDLEQVRSGLRNKIERGEKAYARLDGTIQQTEEGYQRVLDTAQTLMDVVSLQMPQLEEELESAS